MGQHRSQDFRDWDIEAETSCEGVDAAGLPFYLWRESADNRITLSRPRYCCVAQENNDLYFLFFNPSENTRSTGSMPVGLILGGLPAIWILREGQFQRQAAQGLDYIYNLSPPPFMSLVAAFLAGTFVAMGSGILWYVVITLTRWINGRFKGEGQIVRMPLHMLDGFQVIHASETGARINNEPAKTGHGLTAVFSDGTQIILTGNAWDYRSIADQHRSMTNLFCTRRAEFVTPWIETMKRIQGASATANTPSSQSKDGVPAKL